ncbi:MAG: hypothetical protein AAFS10_27165, partial [Myxococcota bacterium]
MEELLKYMPETDDPKRLRRRKMFTELLYKTHPHWFDPVLTREAEKLAAVRAEELAAVRVKELATARVEEIATARAEEIAEEIATARAEEIASDKVKEERLQGVFEFYSLRLGRDLTDDDKTTLAERFERLGGERVRAAVFAFEPSGLEAWLADPKAM